MLYLTPSNFSTVAAPLYIYPTTRSTPVRFALSHSLQAAALAELLATSSSVSPQALYADADGALAALSTLLGEDEWFFGADEPGLFDASVFAYTYLIMDGLEWRDRELAEKLSRYGDLVGHKDRIASRFYAGEEGQV